MSIIQAIILGLVQGITEFVPISSSGHLVIIRDVLGWEDPGLFFDVVLHLGTLIAILVYFRKEWLRLIKMIPDFLRSFSKRAALPPENFLLSKIIIAIIPAIIVGFFFEGLLEKYFRNVFVIAGWMIAMGIIFIFTESVARLHKRLSEITALDSLIIGAAQVFALIPGVSRSGITISVGLLRGVRRSVAAKFSFMLGAPLIFGAGLFEFVKFLRDGGSKESIWFFVIGFVISVLVSYFVIKYLLLFLKKHSLFAFSYYLFALGIILIVWGIISQ
ncbi:undecaprenyl-diphosphatase UppP [Patescibacteria group bacterium]